MQFNPFNIKNGIALILAIILMVPVGLLTPHPQNGRVEAHGPVTVVGGIGTVQDTITAVKSTISAAFDAITSAAISGLNFKEYVLDTLAWFANEVVIKYMTRSIITWINSGFQGSPAFVTDLKGFMRDTADQVIGEFIEGSELGFLCDPFQVRIRIALAQEFRVFDRADCTLSDVLGNMNDFFDNPLTIDVTTRRIGRTQERLSTWEEWVAVTTNPENNPYGAYLLSQSILEAAVREEQDRETLKLEFGRGFLSWENCDDIGGGEEQCAIETPGSVIETQLNETLGSPRRRIEIADELNEITAALLNQLVFQAFSTGLSGLSNSRNGQPSYLNQIENSNNFPDGVALDSGSGEILSIGQTLDVENNLRGYMTQTLARLSGTESLLSQLAVCNAGNANSIRSRVTAPLRNHAQEELVIADENIFTLTVLKIRFEETESAEETTNIVDEFTALARAGEFHTLREVSQEDYDQQSNRIRLDNTDAEIGQLLSQCGLGQNGNLLNEGDGGGGEGNEGG